jgi:hypothetical protein
VLSRKCDLFKDWFSVANYLLGSLCQTVIQFLFCVSGSGMNPLRQYYFVSKRQLHQCRTVLFSTIITITLHHYFASITNKWECRFVKEHNLARDLILQSHEANITVTGVSRRSPSSSGAQLSRMDVKHSQHWPTKGKQRRRVCSLNKKNRIMLYQCKKCDVGLCGVGVAHAPLSVT